MTNAPTIMNVSLERFTKFEYPTSQMLISLVDPEVFDTLMPQLRVKAMDAGIHPGYHIIIPVKDDNEDFNVDHAELVYLFLNYALRNPELVKHVTVHCMAGISRSGAVCDFAEAIGFRRLRSHMGMHSHIGNGNAHIKSKLMAMHRYHLGVEI
jgi:predicted protein tyrosine phosphatase